MPSVRGLLPPPPWEGPPLPRAALLPPIFSPSECALIRSVLGVPTNIYEAAFLLPDGTLAGTLSLLNQFQTFIHHEHLAWELDKKTSILEHQTSHDALTRMLRRGAIRFRLSEIPGASALSLDILRMPTQEQQAKIAEILVVYSTYMIAIDLRSSNGTPIQGELIYKPTLTAVMDWIRKYL